MSTSKYVDKICIIVIVLMLVITTLFMFGERLGIKVIHSEEDENTSAMFTTNDLNDNWDKSDATRIILENDSATINGTGAYFSNNTLYIVYAGEYVISGTLNGSIKIDADGDDKIWLLFDGVDIVSKKDAPLYIKQADKVFLTLKEDSQNKLVYENSDLDSEIDGTIFSRDDLTINGKGSLTVASSYLHGIVCNDSLVISNGNINILAKKDAIHAHDAIKICNASINISAGDDGLHVGNDEESSIFYMESGSVDITECYEGIEANEITIAGGIVNIVSSDDGINANGSGSTSLITLSGGDITILNPNGRDADGLDSNGSIYITGGNLFISVLGNGSNSAIDYGSENGGRFIVSGGNIMACGSSQMAEAPDSDSSQGFITQMVSGNENDIVSVLNADGNEIINKEVPYSFSFITISSPDFYVGDSVKLKIGDKEVDTIVSSESYNRINSFGNPGSLAFKGDGEQRFFGNEGYNDPSGASDEIEDRGTFKEDGKEDMPPEKPSIDFWNNGDPKNRDSGPNKMPDDNKQRGQWPFNEREGDIQNRENKQMPMLNDDNGKTDSKVNINNDSLNRKNSNSSLVWIEIGISAFILIGGIYIAIKKKY